MTSTPAGRPWIILALAIAVLGAAAIAVFVTGQHRPKGMWMVDQKTGCRIWDDLPAANELVSWSGDCKDGYAEGRGTAQWIIKGKPVDRYDGEMRAGRMIGAGTLSFPNGMRYEGAFKDGNFHGRGRLTYANGDVYDGEIGRAHV